MIMQFDQNEYAKQWRINNKDRVAVYRCRTKEHRSEITKRYWERNGRRIRARRNEKYAKFRIIINGLKNRPCFDCHGWFEPCQLQFDHLEPTAKRGSICNLTGKTRLDALMAEVKKCVVVCANCHALRTKKQRDAGMFKKLPSVGIEPTSQASQACTLSVEL